MTTFKKMVITMIVLATLAVFAYCSLAVGYLVMQTELELKEHYSTMPTVIPENMYSNRFVF